MQHDIFSKRSVPQPEVYQYESMPDRLRTQVIFILRGLFGLQNRNSEGHNYMSAISSILRREYGMFELVRNGDSLGPTEEIERFILECKNVDQVLDAIEIAFRSANVKYSEFDYYSSQDPKDAIAELNGRLKEHGVGYQFENNRIINLSNELIHSEVVVPALQFLGDPRFKGANDEFMSAHSHFRHGRHDECLNECLKSFESTLKIICDIKGWQYDRDKDTAKALIEICLRSGLYHSFQQSSLANFRAFLESCVPTARNRVSGHGSGATPISITKEFVEYILQQTALIIKYSCANI